MTLRRATRSLLLVALAALIGLAGYEAWKVWQAEQDTDAILQEALARPRPIDTATLPQDRLKTLLAVEDPGFFGHHGIDISSPGQGMTTITQALVKLLYFDPFKPGFAKIEQSLIAWLVLDRHLAKDKQLALFVNQAYFGTREGVAVRGFADAAKTYYGKPFDQLEDAEYIALVAMLIGPDTLMPDRHASALAERVRRIERLLDGACAPDGVFDPYLKGCA